MATSRLVRFAFALTAALMLSGCVNTAAVIDPAVTIAPKLTPTPTPSPTPSPTPTPEAIILPEIADVETEYDKLGEYVNSANHYQRYITFRNIQVYEQYGDTFMDAIAVNGYPDTLVCAVELTFYDDEESAIAMSSAQTRDGQYVMKLQPGDNTIFARVDTDISLTDKEFTLTFSPELAVLPE